MRLKKVENGHRFHRKLLLWIIGLMLKARATDVIRLLLYRPEFFGNAFNQYVEESMRRGDDWPVGERELFASFVANVNQCPF